jgi:hypothetical protein
MLVTRRRRENTMATSRPPSGGDEETRVRERDLDEPYREGVPRREEYAEHAGPGYGYGPPPGYGPGPGAWGGPWGGPWGRGRRFGTQQMYPVETKPFFLTSEFAVVLIAVIALAITAGASESIDAWRFWILTTALVAFYVVSRGIAKSGTKSRSVDPRDELLRAGMERVAERRERD